MTTQLAVLQVAALAMVRWPDGEVGRAWELPAGALLVVDEVIPVPDGWLLSVHPIDTPWVFAFVELDAIELVGMTVPF